MLNREELCRTTQTISLSASWSDACILDLDLQTNGTKGGDGGHGAYLELKLKNISGVDFSVLVDGETVAQSPTNVTLRFAGDSEVTGIAELLKAAARALEAGLPRSV